MRTEGSVSLGSVRPFPIAILALLLASVLGCRGPVAATPQPNFNAPKLVAVNNPPPVRNLNTVKPPDIKRVTPPVHAPVPADWVPAATAAKVNWKWIVVHHSDSEIGGVARINQWHKDKGWDEIGYHFVIGNGSDTSDGAIEVGSRWPKQKWGAHTKTPDNRYNEEGIGICMVGNFENHPPTQAQMQSLAKLTAYLMRTYNIPVESILGHRDCKPTACPGKFVTIESVRRAATEAATKP